MRYTRLHEEHAGTPQDLARDREKLQAELADHGIKGAIPERQRLAVRGYGLKRFIAEPGARCCEHRWRDVGANHKSRRFDLGQRDQCGLAWSGSDIEHPVSVSDFSSGQHRRHEQPRPTTDVLIVRSVDNGLPGCHVESRSEVHAYGRLVFWCIHKPPP